MRVQAIRSDFNNPNFYFELIHFIICSLIKFIFWERSTVLDEKFLTWILNLEGNVTFVFSSLNKFIRKFFFEDFLEVFHICYHIALLNH